MRGLVFDQVIVEEDGDVADVCLVHVHVQGVGAIGFNFGVAWDGE
jgi:hypothetical protein